MLGVLASPLNNNFTESLSILHICQRAERVDGSGLMMHRIKVSPRRIAQDDTAAPLRLHTPTHLESVPFGVAFTTFL